MSTINSLRKLKAQTSVPATAKPRDLKAQVESLQIRSILSEEPTDTIELRERTLPEKVVSKVRGPILTAAKIALPLIGAAVAGPIGLGLGFAARAGLSLFDGSDKPVKERAKNAVLDGAFATALGTIGLIPGTIGLAAAAATGLGLTALANKVQQQGAPHAIRLETFADSYLPKIEEELGGEQTLTPVKTEGLSPKQRDQIAAQAILNATQVCCDQLSPAIAVALARETAKELIPAGSLQEDILEAALITQESFELLDVIQEPTGKELTDPDLNKIILTDIESDTPAAASVSHVLLEPKFVKENSPEALSIAIGHEFSHLEHRDVVGNIGERSLLLAIEAAADGSLSPGTWKTADQTQEKLNLASAELSREREFRCDKEGADRAIAQGATPDQVASGFREIFGDHAGSDDPFAEHPLTKDRIAAVDKHVKPESKLKLRDFSDWAPKKS